VGLRRALVAAGLVCALAASARANGNDSHLWITKTARSQLPDGTLKRLLSDPAHERALWNGSIFPDGGYVVGNDYGEMAHWEPFVEAYVQWIRARWLPPYDGEAARHIAFLMGVASHVLADQTYDSMFMAKARGYDAAMWSDERLLDFDSNTDVMLAAETGQHIEIGDPGSSPGIRRRFRPSTKTSSATPSPRRPSIGRSRRWSSSSSSTRSRRRRRPTRWRRRRRATRGRRRT